MAMASLRSDVELVEAVLSGDAESFAELYRAHVGAVRAVAASQVRDREAVADVVQDTFLRALRSLPSLQDPARFRPWLLSIARHLATDHLRASGRVTVLEGSAAQDVPDRGDSPGAVAELRELAEQSRLTRHRTAVIALALEAADAIERVGTRLRARGKMPEQARKRFAGEFASRHSADGERLRAMMHYADSTMCRMQFLREYFGEPSGERCGRCDNCRKPLRPVRALAPRPGPGAATGAVHRLMRGETVHHVQFGSGEVRRIEGDQVIVDFIRSGERRVLASYLAPDAANLTSN